VKGVDVKIAEDGEILVKGELVMKGYWGDPAGTAAALRDGWLHTGDIGRFDEDGFLCLLDRKKDVIISGGFNIYPSDLEAVLTSHPDVREAAVVAQPSGHWGETPFAFVTTRAGATLDTAQLLQWTNERLGRMQRLSGLRVVEALPRNAIGKVLKRELRETAGLFDTCKNPQKNQ